MSNTNTNAAENNNEQTTETVAEKTHFWNNKYFKIGVAITAGVVVAGAAAVLLHKKIITLSPEVIAEVAAGE